MALHIRFGSITAICVIVTIVLLSGKGEMLVAGYNTLPKEKRKEINGTALSRFIGVIMLFVVASLILLWAELTLKTGWLIYIAAPLLFGAAVFAIIFTWSFKRFGK